MVGDNYLNDKESRKMRPLVNQLNEATKAYDEGHPIMSDKEWDELYFQLLSLERESGFKLSDSPTQKIVYQVVNKLEKVEHNHKILSLDKTKSYNEVEAFISGKPNIAMCKMDGLTCSLHYQNGFLVSAETRGDGLIGENILHNAKVIPSIPNHITYLGELIIDGEIICPYNKFEKFAEEYKNPRNFAAGSIRLLDAKECATRNLKFVAWDIIKGLDKHISHWDSVNSQVNETTWYETTDNKLLSEKFLDLAKLGFSVVPWILIKKNENFSVEHITQQIKEKANTYSYPIDGVVFKFDDIAYGRSLGSTAHHFKNAIAFKFYDEVYSTIVEDVEWTMGRTGVLTPVAILNPIEIDGTIISRASLHNVSIMYDDLGLRYKGQKVDVFKANMIIPQIAKVYPFEDEIAEELSIPYCCPVCGGEVKVIENNGVQVLMCINPECEGKLINKLDHFAGKKGLDIKGLSKSTLEKLVDWGWVSNIYDIFTLNTHKAEWKQKQGFGEKSVENLLNAIESSKNCTLEAFISAIGIPLIGKTVAKDLVKYVEDYNDFRRKVINKWEFDSIPNFGEIKMLSIWNFDYLDADRVYELLHIIKPINSDIITSLSGMTFVITGKLHHFKNRDELVRVIESYDGKVTGSVTSKTNFLVNNDNTSTSAKNLTAKKLNIPIITEEELINMFNKG